MNKLSHVDSNNRPTMVDVSDKSVARRVAHAQSRVRLPAVVLEHLRDAEIQTKKGPVFSTAVIAGVMGAKRTHELIPFCHAVGHSLCMAQAMEAMTAVSVAALTIYDMLKALSHDIVISETRLMAKSGGKRDFERAE